LDPLLPSWKDIDMLVAFLQRQLISESRKASNGIATNIEVMKEAGSFLAELCSSLANEVVDYRKNNDFSELGLDMNTSERVDGSTIIVIGWSKQSEITVPNSVFNNLRSRYHGSPDLFLSAVYNVTKRYQTMQMILSNTGLDCRLSPSTLKTLSRTLSVNTELWADPLSVLSSNNFCGIFADVDQLFGGFRSFAEHMNTAESLLIEQGGSVAVLPSLDSVTASLIVKRSLNMLEATNGNGKGVPLSFAVFLHMQSFRDLNVPPTYKDLALLDSRLVQSHKGFIRHFELLHASQHTFHYGCNPGSTEICNTGSMLLLLQNESGRRYYPINDQSIAEIVGSMSTSFIAGNDKMRSSTVSSTFQPIIADNALNSIPSSPIGIQTMGDYNPGITSSDNVNIRTNGSRRGRLFELVDDGEDDFAVSEILGGYDLRMLQGNNTMQDVDIEAISIMGIGKPSDVNSMSQSGRFG